MAPEPTDSNRHRARTPPSVDDANQPSTEGSVERGRTRTRRPSSSTLHKSGYHSFVCLGKVFQVEKRWKLVRELGQGAYGVVVSAQDDISGETVAIKLVTRVFDKLQLSKRALREITLLKHFANHENITGLIDMDVISHDANEIYLFMEPMEADLHQIVRSGQTLTNEHVQYFLYQILRGTKYIHSANVIHRDLKPGNLLVNSDCELKICDFGLSRGYDCVGNDEQATQLTEYVATRWYRAPEIMLSFKRYTTAIDVWSIGCIFGELLLGKPLFKGKDFVDQLNKILDILGTPSETTLRRIGSEKARSYMRSLPFKKAVPWPKVFPKADPLALDLISKMLTFDPTHRISVVEALEHPWLASYHDVNDEPTCPPFTRWREIEELQTIDDFRQAMMAEIEQFRLDVRTLHVESPEPDPVAIAAASDEPEEEDWGTIGRGDSGLLPIPEVPGSGDTTAKPPNTSTSGTATATVPTPSASMGTLRSGDPYATYARRASFIQQSPAMAPAPFPTSENGEDQPQGSYIVPARSRAPSTDGGDGLRPMLRTLSTVSIHESAAALAKIGGLAAIEPVGKFVAAKTAGDAPPSSMPLEFSASKKEERV